MPLPKGTRFRVITQKGKKVRLAFKKGTNEVIERKVLSVTRSRKRKLRNRRKTPKKK